MFGGILRNIAGMFRFPRGTSKSGSSAPGGGDIGVGIVSGMAPTDVTLALQSSAVWACCRLISHAVATLPAHVFEETDIGKVKALKHPLYRMLTIQPNPLMTLVEYLQTLVLHLLIYGNAYVLPEYLNGELIALWPIPPYRVRIAILAGGLYTYRISDAVGHSKEYTPGEVIHFRLFSLDGIMGLSPIEYHRSLIDTETASRAYLFNLYQNGGRPQGVLEYPGNMAPDQIAKIRANWKLVHSGPQNAGSIVVLEGGTKYAALAIPPESMEYVAQQKLTVEQIARIYGVPDHLIGVSEKPTYASVEQQGLEFVQYTLQFIVTSIERTTQTHLLDGPFIYKMNLAAYQRSDIKTRYTAYATARQWGWLSVNDIRELEDMNRIGPDGDIYLQPLNMVEANAAAQENTDVSTGIQDAPVT